MNILGINAFVHDSAACLIRDGKIVINIEEERLNRQKHTNCFPVESVKYVMQYSGLSPGEIDIVSYNWHPMNLLKNECLSVLKYLPIYLLIKKYNKPPIDFGVILKMFLLKKYIRNQLGKAFKAPIEWVPHHCSHAASAYYLSPFDKSDILVVDAHGENCSSSFYSATQRKISQTWTLPISKSIGIVYRNFTKYLGFAEFQEGTLMALASYGKNRYKSFFKKCIILREDGTYHINMQIMGYWSYKFGFVSKHLGPARKYNEPITQKHKDIANSLQYAFKEIILHLLAHSHKKTGNSNICLAGGCFLNCDANHDILKSNIYKNVFVPPVTSDTGGALGAALYSAFNYEREVRPATKYFSPFQGPVYSESEIENEINLCKYNFNKTNNIYKVTADALNENKILGWYQGRVECGPRALGNRSILAAPFDELIKDRINKDIKKRESFRPFAPLVLLDEVDTYFEINLPVSALSYYMLLTVKIKKKYRNIFSAVSHVDGTARIQVVTETTNKKLYFLLKEFKKLSGYGVLLNTSFNVHEPIVCSPKDAINTYIKNSIDGLIIDRYYSFKPTQCI